MLAEHFEHDAGQGPHKRFLASQKLVQDDATGEKIAAQIRRQALNLLRRHVGRRAHHGAGHRQLGGFNPRDAEIRDLHPAIIQQNQVGWLDVAVRHTIAVRMVQRLKNFHHDAPNVFQRKPLVGVEVAAQLAAFDKLHGDECHALGCRGRQTWPGQQGDVVFDLDFDFAVLIHRNNARMVQPPRRLRLALEPGQHAFRLIAVKLRRQDGLDGDGALQNRIKPLINDPHGTLAQRSAYQILTEFGHGRHGGQRV